MSSPKVLATPDSQVTQKSPTLALSSESCMSEQRSTAEDNHDVSAGAALASAVIPSMALSTTKPPIRALIAKDCVLYELPPEIRREIFNVVVDIFYGEFPDRKGIRYTIGETRRPRRQFIRKKGEVGLTGLSLSYLPPLEAALFPDTKL